MTGYIELYTPQSFKDAPQNSFEAKLGESCYLETQKERHRVDFCDFKR